MKQRKSIKFQSFIELLRDKSFITPKEKLKKVVNSINFLEISEEKELGQNFKEIERNINESKAIIINQYTEQESDEYSYFVISFKRTILIINQARANILQTILSKKENPEICFLCDTKKVYDDINEKNQI